ncbi:hypothetical protein IEQ34_005715 [Dendrobium chrysotoxum]|uniref:Uncharacterized protein n=1 Tax=Dendrobium chrysotoxum TaxID=161865 RepID=A0AAV7H9E9_DENCH|nr:hypothetical protein IEQ34_005715 [Dendrobium chrysotoxum]
MDASFHILFHRGHGHNELDFADEGDAAPPGRSPLMMEAGPSSTIPDAWGVPPSTMNAPSKGLSINGVSGSRSSSFHDVLAGSSSSEDPIFSFTKSMVKGYPVILMSDDDILKLASPYQFMIMGKFSVHCLNFDAIRNFFGKLKLSGNISIGLLGARHVSIQVSNDLDYSRVFARRAY